MRELGLPAYRFSIAWARILPSGRGHVNRAGLDFYNRLVDALLEAHIEPYVTLYHWDLPQSLQDEGGWPERKVVGAFAEFAEVVSRTLGDRVRNWITLNEPFVSAFVGYQWGRHAPGHKDLHEALAASHHLMLSHALALPVIRENSPGSRVGITLNLSPQVAASPSAEDRAQATWQDGFLNRWFLDPLAGRGYPKDIVAGHGDAMAFVHPGDLEKIASPIDFLGVNFYSRGIARSDKISEDENAPRTVFPDAEQTEMGWEVHPASFYDLLVRLHKDYAFPAIYITENGAAYPDQVGPDGTVDDAARLSYIRRHLEAVQEVDGCRESGQGVFRLVPLRQLRMVVWLHQTLWDCLRRLSDPEAHSEGERTLVSRGDNRRSLERRRARARSRGPPRPPGMRARFGDVGHGTPTPAIHGGKRLAPAGLVKPSSFAEFVRCESGICSGTLSGRLEQD